MQRNPLEDMLEDAPDVGWGQRLRYCRERAGLTLLEVEEIISEVQTTSQMTVNRLEKYTDGPPTQKRQRVIAVLACLVYGIRPESMGLSISELPRFIDLPSLAKALRRRKGTRRGRPQHMDELWASMHAPSSSSVA